MGITIETLEIEQSLQDQRLLTLEQTSDSMAVNVFELQGDVEGRISDCSARNKDHNKSRKHWRYFLCHGFPSFLLFDI